MTGAEASFWLALIGLMIAVPACIVSTGELTPRIKWAITIALVFMLPGLVRLWIAAVAG